MAKYKINKNGGYDDTENNIFGIHGKSRHWHKVQIWLDEGNEPDPADPEPNPPTNDELLDSAMKNRAVKALILTLNDGSFVPGSNYTPAKRRSILKAKMGP